MPRQTQAEKKAEIERRRRIARALPHYQALLVMHALEAYAEMLDQLDRRFPNADVRREMAAARLLNEDVRVAHSIRQWLEDDEDRSSTQPSENDRSPTSPDRSSTQPSENDRSPTVQIISSAAIAACPQRRMVATHYRPDGSCYCS